MSLSSLSFGERRDFEGFGKFWRERELKREFDGALLYLIFFIDSYIERVFG